MVGVCGGGKCACACLEEGWRGEAVVAAGIDPPWAWQACR